MELQQNALRHRCSRCQCSPNLAHHGRASSCTHSLLGSHTALLGCCRAGEGGHEAMSTDGPSPRADKRPLRGTLATDNPRLAAEWIRTIDAPGLGPDQLSLGSSRRCAWRCAVCQHEWEANVASRAKARGCPRCAIDLRARLRATCPPGRSLAKLKPEIASTFVANLTRPEIGPGSLSLSSGQTCTWKCHLCGTTWNQSVANRVKGRGCPDCRWEQIRTTRTDPLTGGSLADLHPRLADEFLEDLTEPSRDPSRLRASSGHLVLWRCSTCSLEWSAPVARRSRGHGCPHCGPLMASQRRSDPKTGASLEEQLPEVAAEFIVDLTDPARSPATLRPGSNHICRWRCHRGHEWETTVASRKAGSGCPQCMRVRRSRLDLQVARALEACTGLEAKLDVPLEGRDGRRWFVDIALPSLGMFIDLDPAKWHQNKSRDARKSEALSDYNYWRARPVSLPTVGGQAVVVVGDEDGVDPWIWAESLAPAVEASGGHFRDPGKRVRSMVLASARREWTRWLGTPPPNSASKIPLLAAEFVESPANPGIGLEWFPVGSNERARWTCSICGFEWEAFISSRALIGTGCPACALAAQAERAKRASYAAEDESLASQFPQIAAEFTRNHRHADMTPSVLRINSNQRCAWRCAHCGHEWDSTVASRVRGRACPNCSRSESGRRRALAAPGDSLFDRFPGIAREFVANVRDETQTPRELMPSSNQECVWRCSTCANEWRAPVASRTNGYNCPKCGRARGGTKRSLAPSGQSVRDLRPDLANDFVEDLTNPQLTLGDLRIGSHHRCLWNCHKCGHLWEAVVKNRAKPGGTGCPACARANSRRSH